MSARSDPSISPVKAASVSDRWRASSQEMSRVTVASPSTTPIPNTASGSADSPISPAVRPRTRSIT